MTSIKIQKFVDILKDESRRSNMVHHKHAAMIVSGGKILSIGFNHDRSTIQKKVVLSYHAEMHALSQFITQNHITFLKNYLNDTQRCMSFRNQSDSPRHPKNMNYRCLTKNLKMIVIRLNNLGQLKNSKPCNHCLESLKMFGIKKVYYSIEDGSILKCKTDNLEKDHLSGYQNQYYKFLKRQKTLNKHNIKN
jgi:deoxycytidylate deaminase